MCTFQTDGADHTLCCDKNNVNVACHDFCKGSIPAHDDIFDADHLLECVSDSGKIIRCMEDGYGKISNVAR